MIDGLNETEEFTEALITKYVDIYTGQCRHIKVKCSVINVDPMSSFTLDYIKLGY